MPKLFARTLLILFAVVLTAPLLIQPAPVLAQSEDESLPAWDGQSRFTVLILGSDRRPGARDTFSTRTDVMILASINPLEQEIGLLHLPRDLHMVPPYSDAFRRINTLMILGEELQEGYGPYYAMDTIQYNLSMYIDRYMVFDFEAFIALIDAMGGLEISTTYDIVDDTYPDMNYGYEPFYLPAGNHVLNGRDALKYARTRHQDTDVMRGIRQMHVIQAVHQQIRDRRLLPQLIRQAPTLLRELDRNIYTDMTLEEIMQVGMFVALINPDNIHTGSINNNYHLLYRLPEGSNVYIPDHARLAELMTEVFGPQYFQ